PLLRPPRSRPFPYTTLFRSERLYAAKRSDDELKLVTFAKRPRLVPLVEKEGRLALELTRHASEKGADKERDKPGAGSDLQAALQDRKSTRLNSSHVKISYAV